MTTRNGAYRSSTNKSTCQALTSGCVHSDPAADRGIVHRCPIRILIADDNLLMREGLEQLLLGQPNVQLLGAYDDLPSLLEAIEKDPPDVVLTDIRMPPTQSDEGIRLRGSPPGDQPARRRGCPQPVRGAALRASSVRFGLRRPRLSAQGTRARSRSTPLRHRDGRKRWLGGGTRGSLTSSWNREVTAPSVLPWRNSPRGNGRSWPPR